MAPYGRNQEREADDIGVDLAARAGYDPKGLPRAFRRWSGDEALRKDSPPRQSFFDTHPATPERVRETQGRAAALRPGPAAPSPERTATFSTSGRAAHRGGPGRRHVCGLALLSTDARNYPAFSGRVADAQHTASSHRPHAREGGSPSRHHGRKGRRSRPGRPRRGERRRRPAAGAGHGSGDQRPAGVRSAVAVQSSRSPMILDFTWIAHGGIVYGSSASARRRASARTGLSSTKPSRAFGR